MKFEQATIKILEKLYEKGDIFTKKEELDKVVIGKNKIGEILGYLNHKKLVVGDKQGAEWRINADGIEFLNNSKRENSQREFNKMVAFTGSILALIGIYNFFMSFDSLQGNGIIKGVFIVLLFMCFTPLVIFVINFWIKEVFGK